MHNEERPSLLLTDLYELTMAAAFFENGFNPVASFELFVRRLPKNRSYLIAAGLEQCLEFIENARFHPRDIEYLRDQPIFQHVSDSFFSHLAELRFTGDICAMPEGTLAFPEEPILRITAPLIEAQIVETFLLTSITYQTLVASKASRIVQAAGKNDVIEFGSRRAHGPLAGELAARAAYLGGCVGTSNVQAGRRFGIPIFGTMAHSFIMAQSDETEAFKQYIKLFPESSTLLIDTYDPLSAVDNIIAAGLKPTGVRIDSGDLANLSIEVRRRLDAGGLKSTKILLSGDLDEFKISDLIARGVKADGYGVGTALVVSDDAPALGGIYKLVELEHQRGKTYHAKFSNEKSTYPGTKQVYRFLDQNGNLVYDEIACAKERVLGGEPLLIQRMHEGKRLEYASETLSQIRDRAAVQLSHLPAEYRQLNLSATYPVSFTDELQKLRTTVQQQHST
jgi:nicotinate phosphoribosyltransferase